MHPSLAPLGARARACSSLATAFLVAVLLVPLTSVSARAGSIDLETANRIVDNYTRHAMSRLPRDWRAAEERNMRDNPPRIDAGGIFQILVPEGTLAFEYDGENRLLHCYAKIHKPRQGFSLNGLNRAEIHAALDTAAAAGVDTGGGTVVWDEVAEGFFLKRTYSEPPKSDRRMTKELDKLMAAGESWFRKHYLEAVRARVRTMRPPASATGRRGDFEVTIVLTPDKRYQDLWRRPPEAMQPGLVTRSRFHRGQDVWALAVFTGAQADHEGLLKMKAQYSFVYPDGSVQSSPVGNFWWAEPPPAEHLQMVELRAALEVGDDTPPGEYLARIMACDPRGVDCVTAETPFRVAAEPAP